MTDSPTPFATIVKRAHSGPFLPVKMRRCLEILSWNLDTAKLDLDGLVTRIHTGLPIQVTAQELQLHAADAAAAMSSQHPDYSALAARLCVANLHRVTEKSLIRWVTTYGTTARLDPDVVAVIEENGYALESAITHSRDFDLDYCSIQSLIRSYLLRVNGETIERPQFLFMRIAVAIHKTNIAAVIETYEALSNRLYTHASPTLFNAGTQNKKFASCFLYQPNVDKPAALQFLATAHELDKMWLDDGGIGMSLCTVPCRRETPRKQPGVMPLMKVYDSHAAYCVQSRERRPSALTAYLPIWHGDVVAFIQTRTARANEDQRLRHVFPALWIPDVFMQKLAGGRDWYLFDPSDVPTLIGAYGTQFTDAYEAYVRSGVYTAKINSVRIWEFICNAQTESGSPFLLYQDNINTRNNQQHLGTIVSSNLCTEIVQYSAPGETAVCTLASIALPRFVQNRETFDFDSLHDIARLAVRNTDRLLDLATYPTDACAATSNSTRAIAIGVQGLADTFMALRLPYDSQLARKLNIAIFETIYHAALEESCDLSKEHGPYRAWVGSPASQGKLQMDMWPATTDGRHDFGPLRAAISDNGLRNSTLTAQMEQSQ
ncbi:ribonucleotide reductase [Earliella scabrosa]|nr:ribonucleotide reductase [Earliella scabrosa]